MRYLVLTVALLYALFAAGLAASADTPRRDKLFDDFKFSDAHPHALITDPAAVPEVIKAALSRSRCPIDRINLSQLPINVVRIRAGTFIAFAHCYGGVAIRQVLMAFNRGLAKEPQIINLPTMARGRGVMIDDQSNGYLEWGAVPGSLTLTVSTDMIGPEGCWAIRHLYENRKSESGFVLVRIDQTWDCQRAEASWKEYWVAPEWPPFSP